MFKNISDDANQELNFGQNVAEDNEQRIINNSLNGAEKESAESDNTNGDNQQDNESQAANGDTPGNKLNKEKDNKKDLDYKKDSKKQSSSSGIGKGMGGIARNALSGIVGVFKKNAPLGAALLINLIIGAFIISPFAVGLAIVQLRHGLMNLADVNSNISIGTNQVFRSKMKGPTGRLCKTGIRCKYKSFSEKQFKKLEEAGITPVSNSDEPLLDKNGNEVRNDKGKVIKGREFILDDAGNPLKDDKGNYVTKEKYRKVKPNKFGRYKFDKMTFVDADGTTRVVTARNFERIWHENPTFRQMYEKATMSKFKALRGKFITKVHSSFDIDFKRKFSGSVEQIRNKLGKFYKKTSKIDTDSDKPINLEEDSKGNKIPEETKSRVQKAKAIGNKLKAKLKTGPAGKIKNFVAAAGTAAVDMACTVTKSMQIMSSINMIIKYVELMKYFVVIVNLADAIKTGDATPEALDAIATPLIQLDKRDRVPDSSKFKHSISEILTGKKNKQIKLKSTSTLIKNPNKNKNAFDSPGIQAVMYGKSSKLTTQDAKYSIGSGLDSEMYSVGKYMRGQIPGGMKTCNIIQNEVVQAASMTVGIGFMLAGIVTGGTTTVAQIAAGAAVSIAQNLITNFMVNNINELLSGNLITPYIKSVDAGNAAMAGAGALLGLSSSSIGLTPNSTMSEIKNTEALAAAEHERDAQIARLEAKDKPFDIYDKYSFVGSIAWNILPKINYGQFDKSMIFTLPIKIIGSVGQSMSPKASAFALSDPDRFNQCTNPIFAKPFSGKEKGDDGEDKNDGAILHNDDGINLQTADIMCNIRYGINPIYLNSDPARVAAWMVDAAQIDPESGEPIKDKAKMDKLNNEKRDPSKVAFDSTLVSPNDSEPKGNIFEKKSSHTDDEDLLKLSVNELLRPDDDTLAFLGIPKDTPSDKLVEYTPGYNPNQLTDTGDISAKDASGPNSLPYPINNKKYDDDYKPERDTTTYAHWYRYCRWGPEDGRTVPLGLIDEENRDTSFMDKIGMNDILNDVYISDGRECVESNACKANEDPNGGDNWMGEDGMKKRCRPAYYSTYEVSSNFNASNEFMNSDLGNNSDTDSNGKIVDGDNKELARKLAEHKNVQWVNEGSREALNKFADTGKATNLCHKPFAPQKSLLRVLLSLLDAGWKIKINNIGFEEDRESKLCDSGMHPKGRAVDINDLVSPDGKLTTNGSIDYTGDDGKTLKEFATQWMNLSSKIDPYMGGMGQVQCTGFNMFPIAAKHPEWKGAVEAGAVFQFPYDVCNHLHIDVRYRDNLNIEQDRN